MRTSNSINQAKRTVNTGGRKVAKPMTNSKAVGSKSKRDSTVPTAASNMNSEKVVVNRLNGFDKFSLDSNLVSSNGCTNPVLLDSTNGKDGSDDTDTVSSYADSLCAEDASILDRNCGVGAPPSSTASATIYKVASFDKSDSRETGKVYSNPADRDEETGLVDKTSNGMNGIVTDGEAIDGDENGEHEDESVLNLRIEEMELRIEKLEEELREVAALEVSLYSVVPEHGSSAHKVHTPARRLSRLYMHACKHWGQDQLGSIAKNTASGFVLIAKSCGNDVPRLTFWLSNVIVLKEVISQAFGTSKKPGTLPRIVDANKNGMKTDKKPTSLKWKGTSSTKHTNGSVHCGDDWQDSVTFISALEKVESWIFSRIVESVWWQALTPHMQPPNKSSSTYKSSVRMLGAALGDHQQGSFSVNLWRAAFQDAFQRLCPVRAGGHECGCLPIIAKMVMEQCVARLDVAMFNAILRESAHETPTDPVSDPIVDSRVLPIPAGNLSFGSGAQLKNSVGNWTRSLSDMFAMGADDYSEEDHAISEDDDSHETKYKSFNLLSDLSDLLMLPKDMLMDRRVRYEVCPTIDLSLVKRILCYFTPDEFCPDPVPGAVLEALNAERVSPDDTKNFPYSAAPVVYTPPSSAAVAEKVAEAGSNSHLSRNVSIVQRKGYTSDEELDELDYPLASIIETSSPVSGNGNRKLNRLEKVINSRYSLLRPVWSE